MPLIPIDDNGNETQPASNAAIPSKLIPISDDGSTPVTPKDSTGYQKYMAEPHASMWDQIRNSGAGRLLQAFGYLSDAGSKLVAHVAGVNRDYGLEGTVNAINSVLNSTVGKLGVTLPQKAVEMAGRTASSPFILAGPVADALGGMASDVGTNIAQAAVKPSAKLLNASGSKFDINNLVGEDAKPLAVPGGPTELASRLGRVKTLDNLEQYHTALDNKYDNVLSTAGKNVEIRPTQAVADATKNLQEAFGAGQNRGPVQKQITDALQTWSDDAADMEKNGPIDGTAARAYRASLRRDARFDMTNQTATPGSRIAASEIYNSLNAQIDKALPEVRPLDDAFAKTIPLRNAIATSLGKDANTYPLGIKETIMLAATHGLDPSSLLPAIGKIATIKAGSQFGTGVMMRQAGDVFQGMSRTPTSAITGAAINTEDPEYDSLQNRISTELQGLK